MSQSLSEDAASTYWHKNKELLAKLENAKPPLLAFHQTAEWEGLRAFAFHLNVLSTGIFALLAGGLAGLASGNSAVLFGVCIIPVVVAMLRQYTRETLDRYYTRFLEAVVCQQKMRWLLGIDPAEPPPHHLDLQFDVERRNKSRPPGEIEPADEHKSRTWVRKGLEAGHNEVASRLLVFLAIAALTLPYIAVTTVYTQRGEPSVLPIAVTASASTIVSIVILIFGQQKITRRRDEVHGELPKSKPESS